MTTKKFDIQVPRGDYYKNYETIARFISYFYQIEIVRRLNIKRILEMGVGNKTVSNYLKHHGFDITTCDFDKELKPDYVADIRDLPFENNSYDVILACEILEHLPYNGVDSALKELHRVTKKYVVVSIPYSSACFEFIFKFPLINTILKKPFINLFFRIPLFFLGIEFSGEHYWEMGRKNYSIRKIRKLFRNRFKIIREIKPVLNSRQYFFVLEKKQF